MTQKPINPSLIARVSHAAQYVIRGVAPDSWFGPNQPLEPIAPESVTGRKFDYPVGYNLNYTPRSAEPLSFDDLRALADNCDILRSVIETRKDQIEALKWRIRVKPDMMHGKNATPEQKERIAYITEFMQSPDKENDFSGWLRQLLEDMFVIDAVSIYKRRSFDGQLYALEIVDGATIKILIDESGRLPLAPDPAYQQVLKGVPAVDYTRDELLYIKHNPRSHKVYGYSHVEQVIMTVNILIRRSMHQLEYYREGSQPDAFVGLPKEWSQEQIIAFQKHFDAMLAGNSVMRRRLRFMPGEFKYQETKAPPLKDVYDEFLARIICYVFSVSPEPFVSHVNRATAQSSQERATQEGLAPLQSYVCQLLNRVIRTEFSSPDLEFIWQDTREQDAKEAASIDVAYVGAGIMTVDEVRAKLGLPPLVRTGNIKNDDIGKSNPYHKPAGVEGAGQFTNADGTGGGGGVQVASAVETVPFVAGTAAIIAGAVAAHNAKPVRLNNDGSDAEDKGKDGGGEEKSDDTSKKPVDIIAPDGNLIGVPGNGPDVQVIDGKGIKGAEGLFGELTDGKGGKDVTPSGYKGKMIELPNGDRIGIRPTSQNGEPAIDVNMDDGKGGRIRTRFKFP